MDTFDTQSTGNETLLGDNAGSFTNTDTTQLSLNTEDLSNASNQNDTDVRENNQTQQDQQSANQGQQTQETDATNANELQERVDKHEKALAAVRKDLRAKGVDLNQAVKEYSDYGALSKQTMADLAAAGYPKEVVEGFLATQQVLENNFTAEVYKAAGGEKEYNNLVSWAQSNLPRNAVAAFNRAIDSNNLETIKLMMDGMRARRTATMGTRNPSLIGSPSTGAASNKGFANKQEMIKAMSDPRYNTDPAYNKAVVAKLLASPNII